MLKVKLEDYEGRESNLSSYSAMGTCEVPIDTVEDMDMPLEGFHANLSKCRHIELLSAAKNIYRTLWHVSADAGPLHCLLQVPQQVRAGVSLSCS